jgi:lipoyl(octanoyl) transferase
MMEFKFSKEPAPYPEALEFMERRAAAVARGQEPELIWGLEHSAVITAGTSAKGAEVLSQKFPVYQTNRGGKMTYHGPGQLVVYCVINLENRNQKDVRAYVETLENWIIEILAGYGLEGFTRPGRTGVWIDSAQGEEKIAAIGVRISKWVTFHGFALNLNPDLSHFKSIIPCGLSEFGVTSLEAQGKWDTLEILFQKAVALCPF